MLGLLDVVVRQDEPHTDGDPHNEHGHQDEHNEEHHDEDTCGHNCLLRWKIGFAVILFLESMLFGFALLAARRLTRISGKFLSRSLHTINAIGGGIFLSTGMLHILPEAVELLAAGKEGEAHEGEHEPEQQEQDPHAEEGHGHGHGHDLSFPTAYGIALLTFYIFFAIEHLVFARAGLGHSHGHEVQEEEAPNHLARRDPDEEDTSVSGHAELGKSVNREMEFTGSNGFVGSHASALLRKISK